MPHGSLRKKFRSFLDIRECRELYDCSGSDDSLTFGLLSPLGSPDHMEIPDPKSVSGDSKTLRRAFSRTFSWKKRKPPGPVCTESTLSEEKLEADEMCKIFIIGYSGIGKTAAVVRFLTGRYIHEYQSSQEESYSRIVNVDGRNINVKLTSMIKGIPKHENDFGAPCTSIMLAYSVVDLFSYHYIEGLFDELKIQNMGTPVVLVGTKSDLDARRCICRKTAEKLAQDHGCYYYELSAASDDGVGDCFRRMIRRSLGFGKERSGSIFDYSRIGRRRSSVS